MLELIHFAWTWLATANALAPYSVVTLAAFGLIYAWRKLSPKSWLWLESRLPFAAAIDDAENMAKNVVLSLPSLVIGAALASLAGGVTFPVALFGALAGACAPLLHHVRKALPFDPYRGALGDDSPKNPHVPPLPALLCFLLLGCSSGPSRVPCDASDYQAGFDLAVHAADCRTRAKACGENEDCKQAVYDDCDAWGEKRCAEGAK